jgi:hypothetical protein
MCAYKLKIEAARARVGETRALVRDPLDPCVLQWDPRETQVPYGTRSFLSWSPMRRTAVLSSAAAAALGHEF